MDCVEFEVIYLLELAEYTYLADNHEEAYRLYELCADKIYEFITLEILDNSCYRIIYGIQCLHLYKKLGLAAKLRKLIHYLLKQENLTPDDKETITNFMLTLGDLK